MAHILVVDDDAFLLHLLDRLLGAAGHTVSLAVSGLDALQSVKRNVPDLILTDLSLPDMHGLTLVRILRGHRPTSRTPVLAMSGAGATYETEAPAAGCDGVISKPFGSVELMEYIQDLLGRGAAQNDRS